MPQENVAKAVLRSMRRLPDHPGLDVLDLSCGRGEIVIALKKEGCRVRGTHYRRDDYKLTDRTKPLHTSAESISSEEQPVAGGQG